MPPVHQAMPLKARCVSCPGWLDRQASLGSSSCGSRYRASPILKLRKRLCWRMRMLAAAASSGLRLRFYPRSECLKIAPVTSQWLSPHEKPSVVVLDFDIEEPDQATSVEIVSRKRGPSQGDPLPGRSCLKQQPRVIVNRTVRRLRNVETRCKKPRVPFLLRTAEQRPVHQVLRAAKLGVPPEFGAAHGDKDALHQRV